MEPEWVADQFVLKQAAYTGTHCVVYQAKEAAIRKRVCAKFEEQESRLRTEARAYRILGTKPGVPQCCWFGRHKKGHVLVTEWIGPSLEQLIVECSGHFSLGTVLHLADQLISRLELLHSRSLLHRNLEPRNCLVHSRLVHLIDFALCKQYQDRSSQQHIPYAEGKTTVGHARFASVSAMLGIEQSSRDDLEALGYMLIYFLRGHLPWQGLQANNNRDKFQRVLERKMSVSLALLCHDCPHEFCEYLTYTRALRFEERPDYSYLRSLFRSLSHRLELSPVFDWERESNELLNTNRLEV